MFATLAVPFDSYRDLPTPAHRWLTQCLARYADREGVCWPTIRQLADDARMSPSTVCRRLKELAELAVFHRTREGVGRYRYTLAEPYRLRWPTSRDSTDKGGKPSVSPSERRVSPSASQEALPAKQVERRGFAGIRPSCDGLPDMTDQWRARIGSWQRSGGRFWLDAWGPKPDEAGCFAPQGACTGPSLG